MVVVVKSRAGERITITASELEKGVESDLDLVCCLALAIVIPFPEKIDSDSARGTSKLTTLHYPRKVGLTPSYLFITLAARLALNSCNS